MLPPDEKTSEPARSRLDKIIATSPPLSKRYPSTQPRVWPHANTSPQHYNHLAHTSKEKEQAAYKQYVESHSVEEIEAANKARVALRRKLKGKRGGGMWPKINDERAVKRPVNPFAQFIANRFASGDFKHMVASQATKLIAQEWKALSEEEKKVSPPMSYNASFLGVAVLTCSDRNTKTFTSKTRKGLRTSTPPCTAMRLSKHSRRKLLLLPPRFDGLLSIQIQQNTILHDLLVVG